MSHVLIYFPSFALCPCTVPSPLSSASFSALVPSLCAWPASLCLFFLSVPTEDQEGQLSAEEEEAKRIAEMGKPILGEHSRLEVVIEESYEFKVTSQGHGTHLYCRAEIQIILPFTSLTFPALSLIEINMRWSCNCRGGEMKVFEFSPSCLC